MKVSSRFSFAPWRFRTGRFRTRRIHPAGGFIPHYVYIEVQLCMSYVGICCTDVHYWIHGGMGEYIIKSPYIPGHEGAGVVSKLGDRVAHLKIGDRVAVEPIIPCRYCDVCKSGRYNLCIHRKLNALPPTQGTLSRIYVHDAGFCYKLPDHVSTEEGALLEPLSVAVHACSIGGVKLGSKILICGAGTIGLVCLLTAKTCGASRICVTGNATIKGRSPPGAPDERNTKKTSNKTSSLFPYDIDQKRLDKAKEFGTDYALNVASRDPRDVAHDIDNIIDGKPDIAIDCSGVASGVQAAVHATKPGGCLVLVGIDTEDLTLVPLVDVVLNEIQIKGVAGFANRYPTALAMVASGKIDVKPLITHRFQLEDIVKAFETAHSGEGIKVMIKCNKD